jgi:hypothetical protein
MAIRLLLSLALILSFASGALAESKKNPGNSKTPPGLAKKSGQMPPGQYKKIYGKGDKLPRGYSWIDDYGRWGFPPPPKGQGYVRYDDRVYRAARDTLIVIEAIGIASDLLK